MSRLVLASGSPRRRELLAALGVSFEVIPGTADETLPAGEPVHRALESVALRKARQVAGRVGPDAWVLGADTAVVQGERVFGKPKDRVEARRFLEALSGVEHRVITAVALLGPGVSRTVSVATRVRFRRLSQAQAAWYASLEEPYDKAGGYAIQGSGAFLVEAIEGSYTNVVGLPMAETADLLEQAGFAPWAAAARPERAHG